MSTLQFAFIFHVAFQISTSTAKVNLTGEMNIPYFTDNTYIQLKTYMYSLYLILCKSKMFWIKSGKHGMLVLSSSPAVT